MTDSLKGLPKQIVKIIHYLIIITWKHTTTKGAAAFEITLGRESFVLAASYQGYDREDK